MNVLKYAALISIRSDIMDDSSAVSSINNYIESAADDFTDGLGISQKSTVATNIRNLKETTQSSDAYLISAKKYCQYEINAELASGEE